MVRIPSSNRQELGTDYFSLKHKKKSISNPIARRTIKKVVASSTLSRNKKQFYGTRKELVKEGPLIKKKGSSSIEKKHS